MDGIFDNIYDFDDNYLMDEIETIDIEDISQNDMKEVNLLDENVRLFINRPLFIDYKYLTNPTIAVLTIAGQMSNVEFTEQELMEQLLKDIKSNIDMIDNNGDDNNVSKNIIVDENNSVLCYPLVGFESNYGSIWIGEYKPKKTTNSRGRKPITRERSNRKTQGDGSNFSSQISAHFHDEENKNKITAFKTFRNGNIQIPGVRILRLDKILEYLNFLCNYFTKLFQGERVNLTSCCYTMVNYRSNIKLKNNEYVNLDNLQKTIQNSYMEYFPSIGVKKIADIKYVTEDTCLQIKFLTPLEKKPLKETTMKIYHIGSIYVMGALLSGHTREIFIFLHKVITENKHAIIRKAHDIVPIDDNIRPTDCMFLYNQCTKY